MGPGNMYFSTSSPTLVLSPQPVPSPVPGGPVLAQGLPSISKQQTSSVDNGARGSSGRGRKRSCDEMFAQTEAGEDGHITEPPKMQEEPIYGEGMTLIQPATGFAIDASSQTGTWAEEKAHMEREAQLQEASVLAEAEQPPALQSRKSQRVEHVIGVDGSAIPTTTANGIGISPKTDAAAPTIDDFTMRLGIGWTRVDSSENLSEAVRGWARYIDNHYPLTQPTLLLQCKANNSFLVGAQEGFFLFDENLSEARLVGTTETAMLANLSCVPIVFEGQESLRPIGTPSASTALTDPAATANGIANESIMDDFSIGAPSADPVVRPADISMQLD